MALTQKLIAVPVTSSAASYEAEPLAAIAARKTGRDKELARFTVEEVLTTRVDGQSNVPGYAHGRFPGEDGRRVIPADRVLGPYEEYVELVEQKRAAVQTDAADWAFPIRDGVEVRATAKKAARA